MNGFQKDDEVFVVGDGPQPEARRISSAFSDRLTIRYSETDISHCVGATQRNAGMLLAGGTHLMFMDDDDIYVNGGLSKARNAAFAHPGKPIIFRMRATPKRLPYELLWATPQLVLANVSTQMFVVPNIKERLGSWPSQACCDFEFILATIQKYPEGEREVVWKDEVIAEIH